jgi:uncharacterized membrane protein YozB (DUF420 family)
MKEIAIGVFAIFASIVFVWNSVYYDKIRKNGGFAELGITKQEANFLLTSNVIFAIISIIVAIWSMYSYVSGRRGGYTKVAAPSPISVTATPVETSATRSPLNLPPLRR